MVDHQQAHKHCTRNSGEVAASKTIGCFCCCRIFPQTVVKEWCTELDGEKTAICPYCFVDSLIGDASGYEITRKFLLDMERQWFGLRESAITKLHRLGQEYDRS